jgi:hypothetical protein
MARFPILKHTAYNLERGKVSLNHTYGITACKNQNRLPQSLLSVTYHNNQSSIEFFSLQPISTILIGTILSHIIVAFQNGYFREDPQPEYWNVLPDPSRVSKSSQPPCFKCSNNSRSVCKWRSSSMFILGQYSKLPIYFFLEQQTPTVLGKFVWFWR